MKKKEMISKIKTLLFSEEEVEAKFVDILTVDGVVIHQDTEVLTEGEPVMIQSEAGLEPASEGEYTLESGQVITVSADGVLATIADAPEAEAEVEAEVEVAAEAVVEVAAEAEVEVIPAIVEGRSVEDRIGSIEDLLKTITEKQNSLFQANVLMGKIIEDYGNETTKKELEVFKSTFSNDNKTVESSLEAIAKLRSKK